MQKQPLFIIHSYSRNCKSKNSANRFQLSITQLANVDIMLESVANIYN